ncbi:RNA methyltransferase [Christiangramia fulva]|uniref:RNA methyltransferase n=1 Tax=Christiangramia fulva TaxID=2126553 RepID=A0A2R3Z7Y5_9FLAO|nr:TrmH family RNA methyltransferase [Christiangramia fulva]AVR46407.1 RNA methyltransferase [Christiangramia fulva]
MSSQLTHNETDFEKQKFPLILVADNIIGEANIGSLFRLSDAFGIEKIVFCETEPNMNSNRLKKTARNTYTSVNYEFRKSTVHYIQQKKEEGFTVISLEIASNSKDLRQFQYSASEKILLVAGNERNGISEEILKLSDKIFHIEMFGDNSSMNVAQSVGIAFYEITRAMSNFSKK